MASEKFKDHFSDHAGNYARYRPQYPQELYDWILTFVRARNLVWDCATGNGQSARDLAVYFNHVIASDASASQIAAATGPKNVEYLIRSAEDSGLEDSSVDLVHVAQALHWFDLDSFFQEANRVLRPGAVLACSGYGFQNVSPDLDRLLHEFYHEIIGPYWPRERKYIDNAYDSIPIPFQTRAEFPMQMSMTPQDFLGYLRTWSACQRYLKATGVDPVTVLARDLLVLWSEGKRIVQWRLFSCIWCKAYR